MRTTWPGQVVAVFSLGTAFILALVSLAQLPDSLHEFRIPFIGLWIVLWLWEDRERQLSQILAATLIGSYFLFDLSNLAMAGNRPASGLLVLTAIILCDCIWLCCLAVADRRPKLPNDERGDFP